MNYFLSLMRQTGITPTAASIPGTLRPMLRERTDGPAALEVHETAVLEERTPMRGGEVDRIAGNRNDGSGKVLSEPLAPTRPERPAISRSSVEGSAEAGTVQAEGSSLPHPVPVALTRSSPNRIAESEAKSLVESNAESDSKPTRDKEGAERSRPQGLEQRSVYMSDIRRWLAGSSGGEPVMPRESFSVIGETPSRPEAPRVSANSSNMGPRALEDSLTVSIGSIQVIVESSPATGVAEGRPREPRPVQTDAGESSYELMRHYLL